MRGRVLGQRPARALVLAFLLVAVLLEDLPFPFPIADRVSLSPTTAPISSAAKVQTHGMTRGMLQPTRAVDILPRADDEHIVVGSTLALPYWLV